jgi:enoyl-CoA hydratase
VLLHFGGMMSLELTIEDSVAYVLINQQDKLNALNLAAFRALDELIDTFNSDSTIRAVVFQGAGNKAFSAGADISELVGITVADATKQARFRQGVLTRLSQLTQPTIAALHGYALGGGAELALACTFRIATPSAKIGLPEVKLCQLPGAGGTQRLSRLIGPSRALDLMLTGRLVGAEEALAFGLVNRVVEDAKIGVQAFLAEFMGNSSQAVRAITRAVLASELPLEFGLQYEADRLTELNLTEDAGEGRRAFLEKRSPVFHQR